MNEQTMVPRGAGVRRRRLAGAGGFGLGSVLALVLAPSLVQGQTTVTPALEPRSAHPEAVKAIGELRSPYCPGLMLEVCPSPPAAELRDSIQMLAATQGMTSVDLVEWMIGNHGEIYRAVPKREGRGLWAWMGPPVGLGLGAVGLFLLFVQIKRRRPDPVPRTPRRVLSDQERARVQAAIREMETLEEPIL